MKLFLICLLFSWFTFAQTKTNLEIFYAFTDSILAAGTSDIVDSVSEFSEIKEGTFYFDSGQMNSLLYNRISSGMNRRNFKSTSLQDADIVMVIEKGSVTYSEMFRKGFPGSFYLPRKVQMSGNYLLRKENIYREFNYIYDDTVAVDSIEYIENNIYPFTQGNIPSEPFFSSILEPVIAIGTTALAVVLFFTIRSK